MISTARTLYFIVLKLRNRCEKYKNKEVIVGQLTTTHFYFRHPSWPTNKNFTCHLLSLRMLLENNYFQLTRAERDDFYNTLKTGELKLKLNTTLLFREFRNSSIGMGYTILLCLIFFALIWAIFYGIHKNIQP